jgi:hypothetical protein
MQALGRLRACQHHTHLSGYLTYPTNTYEWLRDTWHTLTSSAYLCWLKHKMVHATITPNGALHVQTPALHHMRAAGTQGTISCETPSSHQC